VVSNGWARVPRETPVVADARRAFHVKRELQDRYVSLLLGAPLSVTAIRDPFAAWEVHVDDALTAIPLLAGAASIVDVGSGGGSPGVPLAIELAVPVTLLEATGTKARFLESVLRELDLPGTVVHQRSEEFARAAGRDSFDAAVSRALAPPVAAIELCLPLVRPGGRLILWTGGLAELEPLQAVADMLGGAVESLHTGSPGRHLLRVDKLRPTPERFPRRPGMARKRPLASLPSTA
jgi:16S rRNA (guanine527-N7)-methyltransferase